jgi:hypothetical protein
VAVPSLGTELAVARREEVGLARLRGIHGLRLWRFLLLEPLLAIVVGTLAGVAAGAALTVLTTDAWLGEAAPALDRTALLTAGAIALGGLVIVALGAGAALREPLAAQVATRHRPRRATTLAVFLSLLVIVGAGVAAYRSRETAGEPDLLVLLGPALVGLALGQVAVWLVRLAARAGTGATAGRGLSGFLAARRLARADDLVTPLRLVVAAAVVGCLALTGSVAVDRWADGQSRIDAAGTRVLVSDGGAIGALRLTRELDPEAEHLMASVVVPSETRLPERRAYVDAARWPTVVGDFYDGTAAAPAADAVSRLLPAEGAARLPQVTGDRLTVSGTAVAKAPERYDSFRDERFLTTPTGVLVTVDVVRADDTGDSIEVPLRLPRQGSRDERTVRVPGCGDGCVVTGISVGRDRPGGFLFYDDSELEVLLDRVRVGDTELTDLGWLPDRSAIEGAATNRFDRGFDVNRRFVTNTPQGLLVVPLPADPLPLVLEGTASPLPGLVAGDRPETALDLSGDDRPLADVGDADVLPLVGAAGVLSDLPSAALGSGPAVPSAEVRLVADADTPAATLDAVAEATGGTWRPLDDVRRDIGTAAGGAQARAYALTALACALVALLALAAGVARHVRDYRRDVASLRVVGIGLGTARRAGRTELAALTVLVVAAVAVGGWLAVRLLLGGLPLLEPPVASLAVDTSPALWPLVAPAVLAAAVVLVVGGRARAVRTTTTRPSLLREEEGR